MKINYDDQRVEGLFREISRKNIFTREEEIQLGREMESCEYEILKRLQKINPQKFLDTFKLKKENETPTGASSGVQDNFVVCREELCSPCIKPI